MLSESVHLPMFLCSMLGQVMFNVRSLWVMTAKKGCVCPYMPWWWHVFFLKQMNTASGVDSSRNLAGVVHWGQGDKIRLKKEMFYEHQ